MVQKAMQKKPILGNPIAPIDAKAKKPVNGVAFPVTRATTKNIQKGKISDGRQTAHSVHPAKISDTKCPVKAKQAKVASMPEKHATAKTIATRITEPGKTIPAKWDKLSIKTANCKKANHDMTLDALFHP